MKLGSRTVLFGTHSPLFHTWFVAWAWTKLYGFPFDPRLWIAFVVHDLGYWGKPSIDGDEGKTHPQFGARLMGRLFGQDWHDFVLLHSRYYARLINRPTSPLCRADKLAIGLTPTWLYLPLAMLTGEINEYMEEGRTSGFYTGSSRREWFAKVRHHHTTVSQHDQPPITKVWDGTVQS